jgi:DNA processing protein
VIGSSGEGIALDVPAPEADVVRLALDRLDPLARRVFDGLPGRGSISEERLAVIAGVELRSVLTAVPALRLAGLVERDDDGLRISAALRRVARPA